MQILIYHILSYEMITGNYVVEIKTIKSMYADKIVSDKKTSEKHFSFHNSLETDNTMLCSTRFGHVTYIPMHVVPCKHFFTIL